MAKAGSRRHPRQEGDGDRPRPTSATCPRARRARSCWSTGSPGSATGSGSRTASRMGSVNRANLATPAEWQRHLNGEDDARRRRRRRPTATAPPGGDDDGGGVTVERRPGAGEAHRTHEGGPGQTRRLTGHVPHEEEGTACRSAMQISYAGGFKESAAQVAEHGEGRARPGVGGRGLRLRRRRASWATWPPAPRPSRSPRASCRSTPARPTLLAMTAAGIDALSDGRCQLGLGASGPQVIEGWHGVPYDKPLGRTREIIDICRQVWAREERLVHDGASYHLPLPEGQGTGLGKPLKIIAHPVRPRIPIWVASLGPKNVEMTAEVAEGWMPLFYLPEKAKDVWGADLDAGLAKRDAVARTAADRRRRPRRHRRRRGRHPRPGPPDGRPLRRRHGRQGQATSTTTWCAATASSRRRRRSRTSTSTATRTRRPRSCPTSCSRPPRLCGPEGYVRGPPRGLPRGRRHPPQRSRPSPPAT